MFASSPMATDQSINYKQPPAAPGTEIQVDENLIYVAYTSPSVIISFSQLVYFVGQVFSTDQCFPFLHFSLGVGLDLKPRQPHQLSLVAPQKCTCFVA